MSDDSRRYNDTSLGWIRKNWHVLAALLGLAVAFGVSKGTLATTVEVATSTEKRVTAVEREQAVQRQMISDVRDSQAEMRRDIKEILRRVR